MKVLVTGAAGFIGSNLTPKLSAAGYDITLLSRNASGFEQNPSKGHSRGAQLQKQLAADLTNYNQVLAAVRTTKPNILVHLASSGVGRRNLPMDQAVGDNINGTINLLRACNNLGSEVDLDKIIIARTPGELAAVNAYEASKAAAWIFCSLFVRAESLPIIGAMIYQAYGPEQPEELVIPSAFKAAMNGQDFPMTSGKQKKDWIYVDDISDGIVSIIEADLDSGTTIDLGTGTSTTLLHAIKTIYKFVGGPGRPLPGSLKNRKAEDQHQVADISASENQIRWRAKVSLDQGLKKVHSQLSNQA